MPDDKGQQQLRQLLQPLVDAGYKDLATKAWDAYYARDTEDLSGVKRRDFVDSLNAVEGLPDSYKAHMYEIKKQYFTDGQSSPIVAPPMAGPMIKPAPAQTLGSSWRDYWQRTKEAVGLGPKADPTLKALDRRQGEESPLLPIASFAPQNPTSFLGGATLGVTQGLEGVTTPKNAMLQVVMRGLQGRGGLALAKTAGTAFKLGMFDALRQELPELDAAAQRGDEAEAGRLFGRAVIDLLFMTEGVGKRFKNPVVRAQAEQLRGLLGPVTLAPPTVGSEFTGPVRPPIRKQEPVPTAETVEPAPVAEPIVEAPPVAVETQPPTPAEAVLPPAKPVRKGTRTTKAKRSATPVEPLAPVEQPTESVPLEPIATPAEPVSPTVAKITGEVAAAQPALQEHAPTLQAQGADIGDYLARAQQIIAERRSQFKSTDEAVKAFRPSDYETEPPEVPFLVGYLYNNKGKGKVEGLVRRYGELVKARAEAEAAGIEQSPVDPLGLLQQAAEAGKVPTKAKAVPVAPPVSEVSAVEVAPEALTPAPPTVNQSSTSIAATSLPRIRQARVVSDGRMILELTADQPVSKEQIKSAFPEYQMSVTKPMGAGLGDPNLQRFWIQFHDKTGANIDAPQEALGRIGGEYREGWDTPPPTAKPSAKATPAPPTAIHPDVSYLMGKYPGVPQAAWEAALRIEGTQDEDRNRGYQAQWEDAMVKTAKRKAVEVAPKPEGEPMYMRRQAAPPYSVFDPDAVKKVAKLKELKEANEKALVDIDSKIKQETDPDKKWQLQMERRYAKTGADSAAADIGRLEIGNYDKLHEEFPVTTEEIKAAEESGNKVVYRRVRNMEEAKQIIEGLRSGDVASGFRSAVIVDGHAVGTKARAIAKAEKGGGVPVFTSPYPMVANLYKGGAYLFLAIEHAPNGLIYESSRAGSTQGLAYSAGFADAEHVIDARSIKAVGVLSPQQIGMIEDHSRQFEDNVRRGAFRGAYKDKDSELVAANLERAMRLEPPVTTLGRPFTEAPLVLPNGVGVMKGDRVELKGGAIARLKNYRNSFGKEWLEFQLLSGERPISDEDAAKIKQAQETGTNPYSGRPMEPGELERWIEHFKTDRHNLDPSLIVRKIEKGARADKRADILTVSPPTSGPKYGAAATPAKPNVLVDPFYSQLKASDSETVRYRIEPQKEGSGRTDRIYLNPKAMSAVVNIMREYAAEGDSDISTPYGAFLNERDGAREVSYLIQRLWSSEDPALKQLGEDIYNMYEEAPLRGISIAEYGKHGWSVTLEAIRHEMLHAGMMDFIRHHYDRLSNMLYNKHPEIMYEVAATLSKQGYAPNDIIHEVVSYWGSGAYDRLVREVNAASVEAVDRAILDIAGELVDKYGKESVAQGLYNARHAQRSKVESVTGPFRSPPKYQER